MVYEEETNSKRLGELLQKARENANLTQQDITNYTGITKNHVSRIERGESKPSVALLLGYANLLDCSCDEILERNKVLPELTKALSKLSDAEQTKILAVINILYDN